MIKSKAGNWVYSKQERQARWDKCMPYLRRYPTLTEAKQAAKWDGVVFSAAVWLTAFGRFLGGPERKER